jgi:hypothetical protein
MEIEHYSGSQHGMINRCGEQYRRRYGLGEKLPPAIVMVRGRAVHTANEKNMLAKMEGGSITVEEAKDIAADTFKREAAGGYVIDGGYIDWEPKEAVAHCHDDAIALAALHCEEVAPGINPTATEVRIEIPPSDSLPVTFVSILDVVHDATAPIDTKTKAKAPNANEADLSEQLCGQALAFRARYQKPEEFLRLDILVRTPKKRVATPYPLRTTRNPEQLAAFVARANVALKMIEAEIFLPTTPDSWCCSPTWCGYFSTCAYARGRKRPTS